MWLRERERGRDGGKITDCCPFIQMKFCHTISYHDPFSFYAIVEIRMPTYYAKNCNPSWNALIPRVLPV